MGTMEAEVCEQAAVASVVPHHQSKPDHSTVVADNDDDLLDLVPCGSGDNDKSEEKAHDDHHCEAVLEVQDSFVSCVEGVSIDRVLPDGGPYLSVNEASLIRKQATEQQQQRMQQQVCDGNRNNTATNAGTALVVDGMPEIDILNLNLCGTDSEDIDDQRVHAKRVVTPNAEEQQQTTSSSEEATATTVQVVQTEHHIVHDKASPNNNEENNVSQCNICSDKVIVNSTNQLTFAKLPCCGKSSIGDGKTMVKVCSACVVLLTQPTFDGSSRVGRCPRCRSWITVRTPSGQATLQHLDISMETHSGFCKMCKQAKNCIVDPGASSCDACFLGGRNPLLYECEQCHGLQHIPHPMYRYQRTPGDYGTKTWSCEECKFPTHWRLRHDQIALLPVGDAPWPEKDWSAHARQRVSDARRTLQVDAPVSPDGDQCIIL